MGNAQSSGGNHNRLAKPKTITNSPHSTPKTGSPISVFSKYADFSVAAQKRPVKSQVSSPLRADFGCGFSSKDDEDLEELATQVQARLSSLSRSNSVASQDGRNGTMRLSTMRSSDASLLAENHGVDMNTALKILQEVRKSTSPEDLAALHQALQSSSKKDQGLNTRSSSKNRSSSSLTSLRRRSLLATPGLATRNSPTTDGSRRSWNSWKTPTFGSQDKMWKKEMMGISPLTRLAALDLAEDGRESPTPRAQTPGDMEYSHLGSLKLGSLFVANGAPSPAASARTISRRKSNSDLFRDDDYFGASEGLTMKKSVRKKGHSRSKSSVLPETPPLHRESRPSRRTPKDTKNSRCDSPLKFRAPDERPFTPELPKPRLHVVNKSAETLATMASSYIADLPDSPLRNSRKNAARLHDEGFSEPLPDEPSPYREEAFRILSGTIFGEPDAIAAQPESASQPVQIPASHGTRVNGRMNRRPPPSTADSGYSSGGSFKKTNSQEETYTRSKTPEMTKILRSSDISESGEAVSLYDFEQMLAHPSSKPLPPLPKEEVDEVQSPDLLPDSWQRAVDHQLATLDKPEQPLTPVSPSRPTPPRKTPSVVSLSSMQKRLQKRRPSVSDPPVVQSAQPVQDGTIPDVPDNVRAQFVRRLSQAPEMECLTKTYLSKDHTNPEEATIDPPSAISLDFEFPAPEPPLESRARHHTRSHTERPRTPPSHGIKRSLSFLRSRPGTHSPTNSNNERDLALNVVDLGTIGSALGSSPYDAAMSGRSRTMTASPTYPHQLGDAAARTRSMVSMDARTATDFARMRSKERALSRPEMPQRPRSYYDVRNNINQAAALEQRYRNYTAGGRPIPIAETEGRSHLGDASLENASSMPSSGSRPTLGVRVPSTGRGQVVSELVGKYDKYGQRIVQPVQHDWEPHARLWSQRRKSIGEGMRERAEVSQSDSSSRHQRASTLPPEDTSVYDRYSGGLHYGYEGRGYGVGGSAGTRQLHSAASRKSTHYSNQFGLDLSDVPVIVQRTS